MSSSESKGTPPRIIAPRDRPWVFRHPSYSAGLTGQSSARGNFFSVGTWLCSRRIRSNWVETVQVRPTVQAGGGAVELAHRRGRVPLAALFPGQGGNSNGPERSATFCTDGLTHDLRIKMVWDGPRGVVVLSL